MQKLINQLVEGNEDLNKKIGTLVKNGLDKRIQQSLDAVRVIGNESVHPGQIDLRDQPETAVQLFKLVNIIAKRMISEPKEIQAIYELLPEAKREQIETRDNK